MNATGHFLLSWWKHFHPWSATQQSPGLASASLPCGPSPSTPVTTHWPPSRSFPLLTPSSLPWQAQLCPCLLLRLQIGLTDTHLYPWSGPYIRFYGPILSAYWAEMSIPSWLLWRPFNSIHPKSNSWSLPVSGPLAWTTEAASHLTHTRPLLPPLIHSPHSGQRYIFTGRSDLNNFAFKSNHDLRISIFEWRPKYSS